MDPLYFPDSLETLVASRRHSLVAMDPRPTEQQMLTCLRVDHLKWMSGSDRTYSQIEVDKADREDSVTPEAGHLD